MARWSKGDFKSYIQKKHGNTKPTSANAFTKQVIEYLTENGFIVWRNNTYGTVNNKALANKILNYITLVFRSNKKAKFGDVMKLITGSYRKNHGRKGVPDIIGYKKETGQFIGVEIKVGKDTLSPEQKYFIQQANENGAVAIEARTLNDVIGVVEPSKENE